VAHGERFARSNFFTYAEVYVDFTGEQLTQWRNSSVSAPGAHKTIILNVLGATIISQANIGRQPSIRLIQNLYVIYGLSLYRYVESVTAMLLPSL
jgi:hypothetical protein